MKRLLLITFAVALSICNVASQCNFLDDYNNRALGPVKSITKTKTLNNANLSMFYGERVRKSIEVFYYNRAGFLIKRELYLRDKIDNQTTVTFDADNMMSIQRTYTNGEDSLCEDMLIRQYNDMNLVVENIDVRAGALWSRDSIVYNQFGKIALVYHSSHDGILYLHDAYKYDSVGNIIAMRTFTRDRRISCHCDVVRVRNRIELHYTKSDGETNVTKYFYNSKGYIVREESTNYSTTFSDFDSYGNWRRSAHTIIYGRFTATSTITREFEYYDD